MSTTRPPVQNVRELLRPYTLRDLLSCARRELEMRERYYPRRVMNNKMNQLAANQEIGRQAKICELLEHLIYHWADD